MQLHELEAQPFIWIMLGLCGEYLEPALWRRVTRGNQAMVAEQNGPRALSISLGFSNSINKVISFVLIPKLKERDHSTTKRAMWHVFCYAPFSPIIRVGHHSSVCFPQGGSQCCARPSLFAQPSTFFSCSRTFNFKSLFCIPCRLSWLLNFPIEDSLAPLVSFSHDATLYFNLPL